MPDQKTSQNELAVLRQFLSLSISETLLESVERSMTSDALLAAKAAYFMLDVGDRAVAEIFTTYTLNRLMRQINHDTSQQAVIYQGRVRGRVIWPATLKAHFARSYDPTLFVCREARRQYDTPENQLLKFMVERLDRCLKLIPNVMRTGACYLPVKNTIRADPVPTRSRIEKIESAIAGFHRNVYFRDISTPQFVNEIHLLRAETSRTEEYADVARIYRRYAATVESGSWDAVVAIGARVLPLPGLDGVDGDRWIELGAAISQAQKRTKTNPV